jgi:hypothetical protein
MVYRHLLAIASILAACAQAPLFADTPHRPPNLREALENLNSSDTEWRREDAAYRAERQADTIGKAEADEYAGFVATLHRRKLEACEAVRKLGGVGALKGFDCVVPDQAQPQQTGLTVPPRPETAKTEAEKIEALESGLARLEAELDEELLRKQQSLSQRQQRTAPASGGGGGGSSAGAPAAGGAHSGGSQQGLSPSTTPTNEKNAAGKTDGSATEKAQQGASPASPHGNSGRSPSASSHDPGAGPGTETDRTGAVARGPVEDGSDDDIVMRQIREAAERETDPVMKEKLWGEYRKLKAARR